MKDSWLANFMTLTFDLDVTEEPVDFKRRLEDQVVKEIPCSVTLECELTKPNVRVQWMKGKDPIASSDKYQLIMDGAVHRLTILNVTGDDLSDYSVVARGKTSSAKLSIEGQ